MKRSDLPRNRMLQGGRLAVRRFADACKDDKHLRCLDAAVLLPKCWRGGLLHGKVVAGVKERIGAFWAVSNPQLHSSSHGHEDVKPGH